MKAEPKTNVPILLTVKQVERINELRGAMPKSAFIRSLAMQAMEDDEMVTWALGGGK